MKIELDSKNIRVNENTEDLLEDSPRTPEECKARMEEVNDAIKLVSWNRFRRVFPFDFAN